MSRGLLGRTESVMDAQRYLKEAIDMHKKHMDGTLPTTGPAGEKSQREMMRLMVLAYDSLGGKAKNALSGLLMSM